jgi:hypothetical protein
LHRWGSFIQDAAAEPAEPFTDDVPMTMRVLLVGIATDCDIFNQSLGVDETFKKDEYLGL